MKQVSGRGSSTMRKLSVAAVAVFLTLASRVLALDPGSPEARLAGITAIHVVVEDINRDAERDGLLRSTLQTDVELKLRLAGIHVVTEREWWDSTDSGTLYLRVGTLKHVESGLYAYDIDLHLKESARRVRKPTIILSAVTWNTPGMIGLVGVKNLSEVRQSVRDLVDRFINAYLAANPKR